MQSAFLNDAVLIIYTVNEIFGFDLPFAIHLVVLIDATFNSAAWICWKVVDACFTLLRLVRDFILMMSSGLAVLHNGKERVINRFICDFIARPCPVSAFCLHCRRVYVCVGGWVVGVFISPEAKLREVY